MPKVTFRRKNTRASGAGALLVVKLDRKEYKLKNGECITLEVKPGKHKAIFQRTFLARFFGALLGGRAVRLKRKFKLALGEDIVIDCGISGSKIWYEAYDTSVAPAEEARKDFNPINS